MKSILLVLNFLIMLNFASAQTTANNFINPTGTYSYSGKTIIKNEEKYGKFGTIQVKLLKGGKIAMSLYVCNGATAYNSGSFVDTLLYKNNTAIYTIPQDDSSCKIVFTFKSKSISVLQTQANLNNGCGFGHGVFANGDYKKISSKTPVIENLSTDL